jgi:serine/threonine protein kinase
MAPRHTAIDADEPSVAATASHERNPAPQVLRLYNPNRLALNPGTRIGVYEVSAQIGAGGMGQVFRATDTKLKRQVAIKILPPLLAADHDRLARFQREAEVLASLNHPHIAGIYGLEEARASLRS